MAITNNTQQLYGLDGVVISSPITQVFSGAPTSSFKYRIGTVGIDKVNFAAYILTGYSSGVPQWKAVGGGAANFTALTVSPGLTTLAALTQVGAASINATGTGATTIGSATAGAVSIASGAASNFTVTGAVLTLASTSALGTAVTINASSTAGSGVTVNTGATGFFNVANGDIRVSTAAKGIQFGTGPKIITGTGAPTAGTPVNAPQGTLYLNIAGTGINDRAYINTNGTTAWTALVTVA